MALLLRCLWRLQITLRTAQGSATEKQPRIFQEVLGILRIGSVARIRVHDELSIGGGDVQLSWCGWHLCGGPRRHAAASCRDIRRQRAHENGTVSNRPHCARISELTGP